MYLDEFRTFCLSLPGTSESLPFDDTALVFKVLDKMFALTRIGDFESVNLKCDPDRAIELREKHDFIQPGYHMNKKHWNTVYEVNSLDDSFLQELTRHSYDLVVSKMTKKQKLELKELE